MPTASDGLPDNLLTRIDGLTGDVRIAALEAEIARLHRQIQRRPENRRRGKKTHRVVLASGVPIFVRLLYKRDWLHSVVRGAIRSAMHDHAIVLSESCIESIQKRISSAIRYELVNQAQIVRSGFQPAPGEGKAVWHELTDEACKHNPNEPTK